MSESSEMDSVARKIDVKISIFLIQVLPGEHVALGMYHPRRLIKWLGYLASLDLINDDL